MSTNPFSHHTNKLFASRGCDLDAAIAYANEVITAMPVEQHIHATTALMVVINTAANAWTQSQGPSPEKLAVMDLIKSMVGEHLDAWMSDNLENKMDEWVQNSLTFEDSCDSRIESWIENNLDVSSQVEDYLNDNLNLEDKINDLDLVVRVR